MNLQEAIKSLRPFKRPSFRKGPYPGEPWLIALPITGRIVFESTAASWNPRSEDIGADDWELKAEANISPNQIRAAIEAITPDDELYGFYMRNFTEKLIDKLFHRQEFELPF